MRSQAIVVGFLLSAVFATNAAELPKGVKVVPGFDVTLFAAPPNPIIEEMAGMDTNGMTPLAALTTLARLVEQAKRLQ